MGDVADIQQLPRITPLSYAATGDGIAPGQPPRGGVEGLVFTEDKDGTRSMDYTHEGEDYYVRYTPSDTPNCYNFETRTVTNGGDVVTGEYCR